MNIKILSVNTQMETNPIEYIGKIANVCYMKGKMEEIFEQNGENAKKRALGCLENGHHSVFDHLTVTLSITGLDKISACVLNSIGLYSTSERSGRYCQFKGYAEEDERLYCKWREKISNLLSEENLTDREKSTICNENARYFISSFATNCEMIYTINIRTMGYLVQKIREINLSGLETFTPSIAILYKLGDELEKIVINIIGESIISNKTDSIRFFRDGLSNAEKEIHCDEDYLVGDSYHSVYYCSIASLGQKVRSRKLELSMFLDKENYYCPDFITEAGLANEWIEDMKSISALLPQGRLVGVSEIGRVSDFFIYQVPERICSHAMYETFRLVEKQAYSLRFSIVGKEFFTEDGKLKKKCQICGGCSNPCGKNIFERNW